MGMLGNISQRLSTLFKSETLPPTTTSARGEIGGKSVAPTESRPVPASGPIERARPATLNAAQQSAPRKGFFSSFFERRAICKTGMSFLQARQFQKAGGSLALAQSLKKGEGVSQFTPGEIIKFAEATRALGPKGATVLADSLRQKNFSVYEALRFASEGGTAVLEYSRDLQSYAFTPSEATEFIGKGGTLEIAEKLSSFNLTGEERIELVTKYPDSISMLDRLRGTHDETLMNFFRGGGNVATLDETISQGWSAGAAVSKIAASAPPQ